MPGKQLTLMASAFSSGLLVVYFVFCFGRAEAQCQSPLPSYCTASEDCVTISCNQTVNLAGDVVNFVWDVDFNLCTLAPYASIAVEAENSWFTQQVSADYSFNISKDGVKYLTVAGTFHQIASSYLFSITLSNAYISPTVNVLNTTLPIPSDDECAALGYPRLFMCTVAHRNTLYTQSSTIIHTFAIIAGLVACFFGLNFLEICIKFLCHPSLSHAL